MKTSTVMGVIAAVLLGAGLIWHARGGVPCYRAEVADGYRGVILNLPKKDLAWVRKGDSVDVISVFDAVMKGDRKEKIGATLLQNVKVAGVNARKGTIVLLVNINEAQYAALATQQGKVFLSLRAKGDKKLQAVEIASYRKLIK